MKTVIKVRSKGRGGGERKIGEEIIEQRITVKIKIERGL